MKDDVISRQAAIDSFPEDALAWDISDGYLAPHYVRKILEELPSAEPRKGKWAGKGDSEGFGIFICGTCGKFAMMKSNFCPNCGADMRG